MLQGPGENAGVISIGDGLAVAFKIESHNHPSAVEPYQGAATGVGGILRDVFTMGARPIAMLNSLRFGSLDSPRVRYLFAGVVKGIGDYGNCVGIPTVAGEVVFDAAYEGNPLVNAMCVGLLQRGRADPRRRRRASATRSSPSARARVATAFTARRSRPRISPRRARRSGRSVQVGDPFTEKLLLEASLELIRSGHIVAHPGHGRRRASRRRRPRWRRAATSASTIDTTKVPVREEGMTPYEILLSESQERMLVVAQDGPRGRGARDSREVGPHGGGDRRGDRRAGVSRAREGDRVVAEFPGIRLVTDCPTYTPRSARERRDRARCAQRDVQRDRRARRGTRSGVDARAAARVADDREQALGVPPVRHDRAHEHRHRPRRRRGRRAHPRHEQARIALKTDCNGRYVYLDPARGAQIAVAEAARNVACTGARPLAITNNLNFGNPQKPEVYFQLREAVAGMGEACDALGTPVTGGNVSLYNENPRGAVYPTPVDRHGRPDRATSSTYVACGVPQCRRRIVLLGANTDELGGASTSRSCTTSWLATHPTWTSTRARAAGSAMLEIAGAGLAQQRARLRRRRPGRRARRVVRWADSAASASTSH